MNKTKWEIKDATIIPVSGSYIFDTNTYEYTYYENWPNPNPILSSNGDPTNVEKEEKEEKHLPDELFEVE